MNRVGHRKLPSNGYRLKSRQAAWQGVGQPGKQSSNLWLSRERQLSNIVGTLSAVCPIATDG